MNRVKIAVLLIIVGICSYAVLLYSRPMSQNKDQPLSSNLQLNPKVSPQTEIFFTPPPDMNRNATVSELMLMIDSHDNTVSNIQLELKYDPNVITILSIRPIDFLHDPTILINDVDEKRGRIDFAISLPENQPEIKGKGRLAAIMYSKTAQASMSSTTSIEFLPKTTVRGRNEAESLLKTTSGITLDLTINGPQESTLR